MADKTTDWRGAMKTIEEYNAEISALEAELLKPASPKRRHDMLVHLARLKKEIGDYMRNMRTDAK